MTELEPTNEIKRVVETRKAVNRKEIWEDYTIERTVDELSLCLMKVDSKILIPSLLTDNLVHHTPLGNDCIIFKALFKFPHNS